MGPEVTPSPKFANLPHFFFQSAKLPHQEQNYPSWGSFVRQNYPRVNFPDKTTPSHFLPRNVRLLRVIAVLYIMHG